MSCVLLFYATVTLTTSESLNCCVCSVFNSNFSLSDIYVPQLLVSSLTPLLQSVRDIHMYIYLYHAHTLYMLLHVVVCTDSAVRSDWRDEI